MGSIVADMHIHSKYSFDSSLKIKYILAKMESLNAKYVAITDHVEFKTQPVNEVIRRITMRNRKIDELQDNTDITIIKGVEVSEPHLYPSSMDALSKVEDIDYIIGSIHHICDASMRKMAKIDGAVDMYFESMLNMITSANIDTVAHLDYIRRYLSEVNPDPKVIEEILKEIIKHNIALEINTSGKRRTGNYFPEDKIIDTYKKLGGKHITVGSDAHTIDEVGDNIEEAHEVLKPYDFEEGIVLKRGFKKI